MGGREPTTVNFWAVFSLNLALYLASTRELVAHHESYVRRKETGLPDTKTGLLDWRTGLPDTKTGLLDWRTGPDKKRVKNAFSRCCG